MTVNGIELEVLRRGVGTPLLLIHGMDTVQAMRWSAYAAVSNLGTLAVYGVLLFGLIELSMRTWPFGLLGLLLALPLIAISAYVGYRDVFEEPRLPGEVKAP